MAGDSERRLQKVMDKLYRAPKINSHLSPSAPARGKRAELVVRGSLEKGLRVPAASTLLGPAPPCRPWDRGDLMRRLATFKAMTWFAKPKVVSPVNCARRGWINIEMDTIVCEACGARLLFSTPSSWMLQQVENAAAVFSLKLDNGHKLLCPWINNACDEALALFPPTPPPVLIESYRERSSALLRLSALPMISSSAIDYMKSPQLEHFLLQPSQLIITLKNGVRLTDGYGSKDLEGISEAATTKLYFQAQKIISLCGWEPCVLPYAVDFEGHPNPVANSHAGSSLQTHGGKSSGVITYSSCAPDGVEGEKDIHPNLHEFQYDCTSIVLDCRLCGARVGLWAFATVPRPLEVFSFIASSDSSDQGEPAACHGDVIGRIGSPKTDNLNAENQNSDKTVGVAGDNSMPIKEGSLGLNLTIAGGPPPTKQNFKPRVVFPIISRILRAQIGSSSGIRNSLPSHISCRDQLGIQCSSQNDNMSQLQKGINDGLIVSSEDTVPLKRKRIEYESEGTFDNLGDSRGNEEKTGDRDNITKELLPEDNDDVESQRESMQIRPKEMLTIVEEAGKGFMVGKSQCITSDAHLINRDAGGCEKTSVTGPADSCHQVDYVMSKKNSLNHNQTSESYHHKLSNVASCSATNATSIGTCIAELGKGETKGLEKLLQYSVNKEPDSRHESGNNSRLVLYDNMGGFDPIRQHRTFCPWVAPIDGESMPGWKLMLSALCQEKDYTYPLPAEAQSSLMDEVDDPIFSVRRLFMSPSVKKSKIT